MTNGDIGNLAVNVPWNCLMLEDSVVEVSNLYLCLRPLTRAKDDGELCRYIFIDIRQFNIQKAAQRRSLFSLINPFL